MFCGSCMHDNALAKSLSEIGYDIQLVPTYTPIRTDEPDFSVDQVFFGGINVYLQQKIPPLRWLPNFLDRFLDNPNLIRRVTSRTIDMPPEQLGKLAVSMLKGMHGNQRKEVRRLCNWLANDAKPDIIVFTNALIGGCIPEIKRRLGIPVLVTLQGDDVFLDSLPEKYRTQCIAAIKSIAEQVDGLIVHSEFFRNYMCEYFKLPPDKIHVTPLGIDVEEFSVGERDTLITSKTIGYLARLAPEKGLHQLVDVFVALKQSGNFPDLKLRIAGWLGTQNESYANENFQKIEAAGFGNDFEYIGSFEKSEKITFLHSIDLFSVPTVFKEPKGLYALEAMACGIPIVQPSHGSFPELIGQSQGGLLFEPDNMLDYQSTLEELLNDVELAQQLGSQGQAYVHATRNSHSMGQATSRVIENFVLGSGQ